jgi:ubiquinone/menaquinone biosynthesis C-methylase UbiE
MTQVHVKQRYQDETVVQCYDRKRFTGPIGRSIDALEKRAIRRALDHVLPRLLRPRVLDIPCGTGRITEMLLDRGLTVTAGDVSLPMLDAARAKLARYGDRVTFQHLDLEALDLPDRCFDLVTCIRLFNHVGAEEREGMFRELARVTRRYALANLSFSSRGYRVAPYLKRVLSMPMPKVLPTWHELRQQLAAHGFEIEQYFYELRCLSEVVVLVLKKVPESEFLGPEEATCG